MAALEAEQHILTPKLSALVTRTPHHSPVLPLPKWYLTGEFKQDLSELTQGTSRTTQTYQKLLPAIFPLGSNT